MPLGLVSDEDWEKETGNNVPPTLEIVNDKVGRGKDDVEVPHPLREVIAEEHIISGRNSGVKLASDYGVAPSSSSNYAHGVVSGVDYNDIDKKPTRTKVTARERIASRSLSLVDQALNHITSEKLTGLKPTELSTIAKDMASITDKLVPAKRDDGAGNKTLVIIHNPGMAKMDDYEVVEGKVLSE